jgi:hypothetical protein
MKKSRNTQVQIVKPSKKKKMADPSWILVVNLASTNRPSKVRRRSMQE